MRGDIIYKILDVLGHQAHDYLDFTEAFLRAGYGASGGKIDFEYSRIRDQRIKKDLRKLELAKFRKYVSKLKRDGLVLENNSRQIYLSQKGKDKLKNLQNSVSLNKNQYVRKIGDRVIVVSYDIPTAFNRERNILRSMLNMLGFNLIHKSVWVGKVSLPERFLGDLNALGILDYIQILEVTKNGTLKEKA